MSGAILLGEAEGGDPEEDEAGCPADGFPEWFVRNGKGGVFQGVSGAERADAMDASQCRFTGCCGGGEEVSLIPAERVGWIIHGGSMPEGVGHRVSKGSAPGARGS